MAHCSSQRAKWWAHLAWLVGAPRRVLKPHASTVHNLTGPGLAGPGTLMHQQRTSMVQPASRSAAITQPIHHLAQCTPAARVSVSSSRHARHMHTRPDSPPSFTTVVHHRLSPPSFTTVFHHRLSSPSDTFRRPHEGHIGAITESHTCTVRLLLALRALWHKGPSTFVTATKTTSAKPNPRWTACRGAA